MNEDALIKLSRDFLQGEVTADELVRQIATLGIAKLSDTQVDLHREARCGFPEVIFAEGKAPETVVQIARLIAGRGHAVLATRVSDSQADALLAEFPSGIHQQVGRTFRYQPENAARPRTPAGKVGLITAGTSDLPVAEEAKETLAWMGCEVVSLQDVGVAGPHRFLIELPRLRQVDAAVVVAGMEGALPSVVGGYLSCPVIAVPTSVGYGANFFGLAALLSMLNCCASNVSVVNIDAGFKGAYVAGMIARQTAQAREGKG